MTPPPDELRKSGSQRADELRALFNRKVQDICEGMTLGYVQHLTIEDAEKAVFMAAEDIVATLRGRVRKQRQTGKAQP